MFVESDEELKKRNVFFKHTSDVVMLLNSIAPLTDWHGA